MGQKPGERFQTARRGAYADHRESVPARRPVVLAGSARGGSAATLRLDRYRLFQSEYSTPPKGPRAGAEQGAGSERRRLRGDTSPQIIDVSIQACIDKMIRSRAGLRGSGNPPQDPGHDVPSGGFA